jgi:hypothetical protein
VFIAAPPIGYSWAGETARSNACGGPNESAAADAGAASVAHVAASAIPGNRRDRRERWQQATPAAVNDVLAGDSMTACTRPLLKSSAISSSHRPR